MAEDFDPKNSGPCEEILKIKIHFRVEKLELEVLKLPVSKGLVTEDYDIDKITKNQIKETLDRSQSSVEKL